MSEMEDGNKESKKGMKEKKPQRTEKNIRKNRGICEPP
jgi:hypothetical protein